MTPPDPAKLSPADADALDALVEAGFDAQRVPLFQRQRAERIASMLGLLEPLDVGGQSTTPSAGAGAGEPTLSPADALALDALVEAGWKASGAPVQHVQRAGLIANVLSALDAPAQSMRDDGDESVIDATLARIERSRRALRDPAPAASSRRLGRFRLPDLVSAAAIILIGVSILWPMLSGLRFESMRAANQARLANAGLGFGMYASEHRGRLPVANDSLAGRVPGVTWWDVGDPSHSHSAHLFVLVKQGYASLEDLAAPTNPFAPIRLDLSQFSDWRTPEEVSYSYQLLGPSHGNRWITPSRTIVLTDRSPIVERARRGKPVDPMLNSANHRGQGQHALFNDRSVRWLDSPVTPWGDNIWLPRSLEGRDEVILRGTETPDGPDDVFVGP